jgi:tetratricopeptide (TPR) repeat protein
MRYNVKIRWETRLAGVGESAIKKRLCYFSTLTKVEVDVGIDFVCELIKNDVPYAKFNVQAKGTGHFDQVWGQSIKKSTIIYWLKQQEPVYLIVYDDESGNCYWMSIEDYRYEFLGKVMNEERTTESVYIRLDRSRILEDGKEKNEDFKRKIITDKYSIEQFWGRPQARGDGYVKTLPFPPRNAHELIATRENIRLSLYSLVIHYLGLNDLKESYLYCDFLTKFDHGHYNHFEWLGILNLALKRPEKAKEAFQKALKICLEDKNWPPDNMKIHLDRLKDELEAAEEAISRKSLARAR